MEGGFFLREEPPGRAGFSPRKKEDRAHGEPGLAQGPAAFRKQEKNHRQPWKLSWKYIEKIFLENAEGYARRGNRNEGNQRGQGRSGGGEQAGG
jgi:hypothetical protein